MGCKLSLPHSVGVIPAQPCASLLSAILCCLAAIVMLSYLEVEERPQPIGTRTLHHQAARVIAQIV